MKILIIDDEPLNVALLEDLLSEAGYKQKGPSRIPAWPSKPVALSRRT